MTGKKKIVLALITVFILSVIFYLVSPRRLLFLDGKILLVELARTPRQQQKGLQGRTSLGENRGMLFIFNTEDEHYFWMKETYLPLDIAFIDKNKAIVDIQEMAPLDVQTHHRAKKKAKYALEVNAGWFKKNKVTVGSRIYFW